MAEQEPWRLQIKTAKNGTTAYRVVKGATGCNVAESAVWFRREDATENCEVLVETRNGQPVKVTIPGKPEIQSRQSQQLPANRADQGRRGGPPRQPEGRPAGGGHDHSGQQRSDPRRDATAPYNFVTAESPLAFDEGHAEPLYSGELDCSGAALTPLLVASTQDRDRSDRNAPAERRFFTVNRKPVIPGASLKGMLRGMVEALARAPMRGFVSHRSIGTRDVSEPKSDYSKRFGLAIAEGRLRAGFLEQKGANVSIVPCEYTPVRISDLGLTADKRASATRVAQEAIRRPRGEDLRVRFTIGQDAAGRPLAAQPQFVRGDAGGGVNPGPDVHEGRFVPTGGMAVRGNAAKDKGYVFHGPRPADAIRVDDHVVEAFNDQRTKAQDELLAFYRANRLRVPVFYLVEQDRVSEYGLCRFFRVKTRFTAADLASALPENSAGRPMSELLFGAVGILPRRGRVRCSCGTFDQPGEAQRFPNRGALVAGNPAASAITMYLVQDSPKTYKTGERNRQLITYDDEQPVLRGRKLYWHRMKPSAPAPPNQNPRVQAIYHPLPKNVSFRFRVSFERLTLGQLGALCEAIDLPEGHAHKLGLGKPFGLGSVRLTIDWSRSHIASDRDRYSSLTQRLESLAASSGTGGEDAAAERSWIAADSRRAFHTMVVTQSGQPSGDFEKLSHVRQLRALTNCSHAPDPNSIAYMPLNSQDRSIPSYAMKPILEEPKPEQGRDAR